MQQNGPITESFAQLNLKYIKFGYKIQKFQRNQVFYWYKLCLLMSVIIIIFSLVLYEDTLEWIINYCLGVRCIIPNNYFVWEATRPISNCQFCINVTKPIVLQNITSLEFAQYAYSSKPIVVKKAFLNWPAYKLFNFHFFKSLYEKYEDGVKSVDEDCQFLHFKSDFNSLQDVFDMSASRVLNKPGEKSWYVGWGNCHPQILNEMRQYYTKPHFLPEDSEMPAKDYVFMGYDAGATMHLDFISRLMWQAQLKGSKTWKLLPSNECEDLCSSVMFNVEPGDAEVFQLFYVLPAQIEERPKLPFSFKTY